MLMATGGADAARYDMFYAAYARCHVAADFDVIFLLMIAFSASYAMLPAAATRCCHILICHGYTLPCYRCLLPYVAALI